MIKLDDITPIVISYYRPKRLEACLNTLKNCKNIFVWDNNTTGDDLEEIKKIDKSMLNVTFNYSTENVGCPEAYNKSIIESKTDWVLLTVDDMIFDDDWFEILNDILNEKPHLEQIYLNTFNCMVFHKKTIARMGWFDERYRHYPSAEDDDWYLRTVDILGYSTYAGFPDHLSFPDEYKRNVTQDDFEELLDRDDNFTYFCNLDHSKYKIIGGSTNTGGEDDAGSRNTPDGSLEKNKGETGVEFHHRKWEFIHNIDPLKAVSEALLSKDSRVWKRKLTDIDFYPEVRLDYILKYFGEEVYDDFIKGENND